MVNRIFLLIVFSSIGIHSIKANPHLDSLKLVLDSKPHDTIRYEVLDKLAQAYSDSAHVQSIYFWRQALEVVKKRRDRPKIAYVYSRIGQMFLEKGELDESLNEYQNALSMYLYLKDDKGLGISYNDIGLLYRTWGRYDEALEHYLKALFHYQAIDLELGVGMASNNLGQIYFYRNDFSKAIQYFTRYLDVSKKTKNARAVAGASNNIAAAHSALGNYEQALVFYEQALHIYDSLGVTLGVAVLSDNIGSLFSQKNDFDNAISHHLKAVRLFQEMGNQVRLAEAYKNLGNTYYRFNDFNKSIKYLLESKTLAENNNLKQTLKDVYLSLSNAFDSVSNHKESLKFYRLFVDVNDSLQRQLTDEKLASFEIQYEADRKAKELLVINARLEQQKNYGIIFSSIGLLFVAISMFVIVDSKKRKKENKQLQKTTEGLQSALESLAIKAADECRRNNKIFNILSTPQLNQLQSISYLSVKLGNVSYLLVLAADDNRLKPEFLIMEAKHFIDETLKINPALKAKYIIEHLINKIKLNRHIYKHSNFELSISLLILNNENYLLDFYGDNGWIYLQYQDSNISFTKELTIDTEKKDYRVFLLQTQPTISNKLQELELIKTLGKTIENTMTQKNENQLEIIKSTLDFWQASLASHTDAAVLSFNLK